jgi:hypothetical protein
MPSLTKPPCISSSYSTVHTLELVSHLDPSSILLAGNLSIVGCHWCHLSFQPYPDWHPVVLATSGQPY